MLDELQRRYPLHPTWGSIVPFTETVNVADSPIELVGISTIGPDGECVTGSAASAVPGDSCVARSYFELIERVSVLEAVRVQRGEFQLRDGDGRTSGWAAKADLFPESTRPERWRFSRSNGVALHRTWREACARAAAELIERDRVLRSWYGESVPRRIDLPERVVPRGARTLSSWTAYEIPPGVAGVGRAHPVVAVVGVPRDAGTALVYGFASQRDLQDAITAAAVEAVQRFGFLLGEPIPEAPPEFSPTPDYHQEFFLHPPSYALLAAWLDPPPPDRTAVADEAPVCNRAPGSAPSMHFVDLTPPHLAGVLFVAKAVCAGAEPLVFGDPAPHRASAPARRRVHPIA